MQGYLQRCDVALVVSFAQGLSFGLDVDKVTFIITQYMLVVEWNNCIIILAKCKKHVCKPFLDL